MKGFYLLLLPRSRDNLLDLVEVEVPRMDHVVSKFRDKSNVVIVERGK